MTDIPKVPRRRTVMRRAIRAAAERGPVWASVMSVPVLVVAIAFFRSAAGTHPARAWQILGAARAGVQAACIPVLACAVRFRAGGRSLAPGTGACTWFSPGHPSCRQGRSRATFGLWMRVRFTVGQLLGRSPCGWAGGQPCASAGPVLRRRYERAPGGASLQGAQAGGIFPGRSGTKVPPRQAGCRARESLAVPAPG